MSEHVERWRLRVDEWLDLQKAANLLREVKNDVFADISHKAEGKTNAEKERNARRSTGWREFRDSMIHAEDKATRARMNMKFEEMQFQAWQTKSANERKERSRY